MNERIRQFAEQAGILKEQTVKAKIVKNEDGSWTSILEYPDLEKFAELLIRQCMRMCDCADVSLLEHNRPEEASGAAGAKQFIKEWFEVEE
jgi:predicted peroxiredoxin